MRHRVAEQVLELGVQSEATARALHAEITTHFRERVGPVLEAAFDALCTDDATLRIRELELELPALRPDHFVEDLVAHLRECLPAALVAAEVETERTGGRATGFGRFSAAELELELVLRLLTSGTIAPRDAGLSFGEFQARCARALERAPEQVIATLRALPREIAGRRVAAYFPHQASRVVELMDPEFATAFDDVATALGVIVRVLGEDSPTLAARVAAAVGEHTATRRRVAFFGTTQPNVAERVVHAVLEAVVPRSERSIASELVGAAKRALGPAETVRIAIERWAAALGLPEPIARAFESFTARAEPSVAPGDAPTRGPASTPGDGPMPSAAQSTSAASAIHERATETSPESEATRETASLRHDPATPATPFGAASSAENHEVTATTIDAPSRADQSSALRPLAPHAPYSERTPKPSPSWTVTREEGTWVARAGLVIAWPFVPAFFQKLGLVSDNRFTTDDARMRGALWCAHLANGALEWPEHELVLPKLLAGLELVDAIETRLAATGEELAEAQEVLSSLLAHWTALKSASIAALRATFFERPGTLRERESGPLLELARTGPDVLLDRLPWGIGLVMLPWMRAPLHVEWQ